MAKINEREGQEFVNKFGSKLKIIKYISSRECVVEFENGYITKCEYKRLLKQNVISPYDKTVCGVGYIGEGDYEVYVDGKNTEEYSKWHGMMTRCYNPNYKINKPTYKDCEVCEEWHNFQNFAKWYNEEKSGYQLDELAVDKDILVKGNKIYSPETCLLVNNSINSLFTKRDALRGDLPIGVAKKNNKYVARIRRDNTYSWLGTFDNPIEAFNAYKLAKENHIKQVAEEYKDKIPERLYKALCNYEVEITD